MAKEFFIRIGKEQVPVTEEVYRAFKRPAWAERKRRKVRTEMERSLEVFMNDGFDIPSKQVLVDEIVADKLLLDKLYTALAELKNDERSLIDALYFQGKPERDIAAECSISQTTINYRKKRLLEWLRKKLEDF